MYDKDVIPVITADYYTYDLAPETDGLGLPPVYQYISSPNTGGESYRARHSGADIFHRCKKSDKSGYYKSLMYRMAATCIRQHLEMHPSEKLDINWGADNLINFYHDAMTKTVRAIGQIRVKGETLLTYDSITFEIVYSHLDEVQILTLNTLEQGTLHYKMTPNMDKVCHPQSHFDSGAQLTKIGKFNYKHCDNYLYVIHDATQKALVDCLGSVSGHDYRQLKSALRHIAVEFRREAAKFSNLSHHMGDIIMNVEYSHPKKEFIIEGVIQVLTYMGNVGYLPLNMRLYTHSVFDSNLLDLGLDLPPSDYDGIGKLFHKQVPQYFKNSKPMGSSMVGDAMKSLGDAFKDVSDSSKGLPDHLKEVFSKPPQHHSHPCSVSEQIHDYVVDKVKQSGDTMKQPNTQAGLKAGMSLADAVAHAQKAKAATLGNKEAKLMSKPTATGLAGFFKTRVKKHFGKTVTVNAKGFGQLKQLITRVGEKRVYRAMESVLDNWDDFLLYVKQEKNWTPDCNVPNIGILLHLADEVQEFYAMQSGDKDVDEGKTAFQTQDEINKSNDNTINDIWG